MKRNNILENASFEEQKGVKILHVKGSPYEMGYQHGYLLADKIALMINRTLLATSAYVATQTNSDLKRAQEMLWIGQKAAEPFVPEEFKDEMKGIADGAKDAGVKVTFEQILLWNTNYDQWCIYCHPHYWQCDDEGNPEQSGPKQVASGGCSSFCAWDEWAGGDGELIFGKNEDNFNP